MNKFAKMATAVMMFGLGLFIMMIFLYPTTWPPGWFFDLEALLVAVVTVLGIIAFWTWEKEDD